MKRWLLLRSALSDICKHSPELAQTVVDAGGRDPPGFIQGGCPGRLPGDIGDDGFEEGGYISLLKM